MRSIIDANQLSRDSCLKNGRLKEFTSTSERRITWTYDEILEEAKKYTNKSDFQKYGKGAYPVAKRLGCF